MELHVVCSILAGVCVQCTWKMWLFRKSLAHHPGSHDTLVSAHPWNSQILLSDSRTFLKWEGKMMTQSGLWNLFKSLNLTFKQRWAFEDRRWECWWYWAGPALPTASKTLGKAQEILQSPWETHPSVLAANGEWDYTSHSFTSSNVNIAIQISNCSFLNPWLSILLEILWQCIPLPCPFISLRRTPCHLLWPCLYSCISRKGEKRVSWIIFEYYSLFDTSLPFSFLLATKFIFRSWQPLIMHKPSPVSNHFHQLSVNFLYFSCIFFEMEMNTVFKAKAHHPFM